MGGEAGAGDVGAQRADGDEDDRPAVDLCGRGGTVAAAAGAAPGGRAQRQRQGGEERGGVDGGGEAGRAPQPAPPARG